jgi:hypothetical protein
MGGRRAEELRTSEQSELDEMRPNGDEKRLAKNDWHRGRHLAARAARVSFQ